MQIDTRRSAPRAGRSGVSGSDALSVADGAAERAAGPAGAGEKGLEAKADALIDRIGLQAFNARRGRGSCPEDGSVQR